MMYYSVYFRELHDLVRSRIPIWLIMFGAAFSCISLFHFAWIPTMESYRIDVTVADIFILTASNPMYSFLGMFLVPVSCIALMVLGKDDYSPNRVIRHGDYKKVWCCRAIKTAFVSLIFSVMILLSTIAVALVRAQDLVRFDDPRGIFAYANNGQTIENPPLLYIVLLFWCYCFMMLLFAGMLWSLLDTLIGNRWIPFILVLLISIFDWIPAAIRTIYLWVSIGYDRWLPGGHTNLWLAVMLVALLTGLGFALADRKEILNAR